jgi:hypothetical protein
MPIQTIKSEKWYLTTEESRRDKPETERRVSIPRMTALLLSIGRGGSSKVPADQVRAGGIRAADAARVSGRMGRPLPRPVSLDGEMLLGSMWA